MFRINTWRSFILFEVEVENFERVTNGGGVQKICIEKGAKISGLSIFLEYFNRERESKGTYENLSRK